MLTGPRPPKPFGPIDRTRLRTETQKESLRATSAPGGGRSRPISRSVRGAGRRRVARLDGHLLGLRPAAWFGGRDGRARSAALDRVVTPTRADRPTGGFGVGARGAQRGGRPCQFVMARDGVGKRLASCAGTKRTPRARIKWVAVVVEGTRGTARRDVRARRGRHANDPRRWALREAPRGPS